MKFFAGVIVGIVIGRPVLKVVNDHLTPPARRVITDGVNKVANYLNARIDCEDEYDH